MLEPSSAGKVEISTFEKLGGDNMHARLAFDRRDLRKFQTFGRFTPSTVIGWLAALNEYRPRKPVLCDANAVQFDIPSRDVISAAHAFAASGAPNPERLAFYVHDQLAFGMLRMFISSLGPAADRVAVFHQESDAIDWLEATPDSKSEPELAPAVSHAHRSSDDWLG